MTKEDLYPQLPNQVILNLEDGTELRYAVSDDVVSEILETVGKWGMYPPIRVLRLK